MESEFKNVSQKELALHMAQFNGKRGMYSSIVIAAFLGMVCIERLAAGLGEEAGNIVTVIIMELAAAVLFRNLVNKREKATLSVLNRLYYCLTMAGLLVYALFKYRQSGSLLALVIAVAFYIFVPVTTERLQKIASILLAAAGVCFCLALMGMGAREIFEAAVVLAAAVPLSIYCHGCTRQQLRLKDELMENMAFAEQDELTGLTNRRGLERRINVLWPYCERMNTSVGIIAIDIDFFKKYNDKFGHPKGDLCLKKVSSAIRQTAKRKTDITVRTGGEEFLVFVQNMTNEDMVRLALEIKRKVAELKIPHAYAGVSPYVTVSMGIACFIPDENNSFHQLYENADKALYTAKENGRNCIVSGGCLYGRTGDRLKVSANG